MDKWILKINIWFANLIYWYQNCFSVKEFALDNCTAQECICNISNLTSKIILKKTTSGVPLGFRHQIFSTNYKYLAKHATLVHFKTINFKTSERLFHLDHGYTQSLL